MSAADPDGPEPAGGPEHAGDADVAAVLDANSRFYQAIEEGDLDAMEGVWVSGADADDRRGAVCVHPGWTLLRGRAAVLRSYALIMANTEYIQFFLTDVEVDRIGPDVALVTCTENILSGGAADESGDLGPLVGGRVVAGNLFRRTGDGWRLCSHHGSPVLLSDDQSEGLEGPEGPEGAG